MRKFGGKILKKNKSGTITYTYDKEKLSSDVPPTKYIKEIENHFNKVFPGHKCTVFHEIASEVVHIDVHILTPNEKEPFYILYTTGMSDLPMTMPEQIPEEMKEELQYAEMMIFLPEYWDFSHLSQCEDNYFPIRLLKALARFPHIYHSWLGYGHTIASDMNYTPYAENTGLNASFLYQLKNGISEMKTKDGNIINFYFIVPIYKEEVEYKLEYGADALLEKLDVLEEELLFLNPQRINTCARK